MVIVIDLEEEEAKKAAAAQQATGANGSDAPKPPETKAKTKSPEKTTDTNTTSSSGGAEAAQPVETKTQSSSAKEAEKEGKSTKADKGAPKEKTAKPKPPPTKKGKEQKKTQSSSSSKESEKQGKPSESVKEAAKEKNPSPAKNGKQEKKSPSTGSNHAEESSKSLKDVPKEEIVKPKQIKSKQSPVKNAKEQSKTQSQVSEKSAEKDRSNVSDNQTDAPGKDSSSEVNPVITDTKTQANTSCEKSENVMGKAESTKSATENNQGNSEEIKPGKEEINGKEMCDKISESQAEVTQDAAQEKKANVDETANKAKERPPTYTNFPSSLKAPTLQTWVKNVRENLRKKNLQESVMAQFSKCKTDEDRITLLYNLPIVHEEINVKECYKGKDEPQAKSLRLQGNTAFQKKEYDSALQLYSESIRKAASTEGSELALAFANRSVVLYHKQLYVLCLQDIRQAFKFKYPDHLQYKLYERRGKSCFYLRQKEEAICAFQDALNVLDKAQLDQQKLATVKSDLQKQLQKCSKLVEVENTKTAQDFNHNHGAIPVIKGTRSNHIPCMGTSLEMKVGDADGRGLYATRNIEVGEVLIIEKPYASVTLADYNLTHCHHCCNRVTCLIPCEQCSGVIFCSQECQQTAWAGYHYAECKYHDLIQQSQLGMADLALRMVLKAGYRYLKDYKKRSAKVPSNPLDIGCNERGVYESYDYHSVYNLVAHTKDRSSQDLFMRGLAAVFLLKCIENSEFFPDTDDEYFDLDEEKVFIGGHILRHIQMLPCNAHEVTEYIYKAFSVQMSEPEEVGSAVYSTLSLINHSCDPSVVRHSYGNTCVVRAIRNIAKGEEITDNYSVLYPVLSKQMRLQKLRSQYYFNCSCHACICNWPMYEKIRKENPVLKCKKCKIGRVMLPPDNQTTRAICEDCREVMDITPDLLHLSKSENFFQGCLDKILKGEERTEGLHLLEDHLRLIDRLLLRPWKDYNDCQEAIKQCYSIMGNCKVVVEPDTDDEELMESEHRRR